MSGILTWLVVPRDGQGTMKDPSGAVPSSKRLAGKDKIIASAQPYGTALSCSPIRASSWPPRARATCDPFRWFDFLLHLPEEL